MERRELSKDWILVTGAAGFIGSALIRALNAMGLDNILAVDRLDSSIRYRNLVPLAIEDYWDADDLLAKVQLQTSAMPPIHTVFHLGACASTGERDARFLLKNNFECTKILANWALSRRARFVYASSAATYGDGSAGMEDRDAELAKLRPSNPYAYSKHLFDCHALRQGFLQKIYGAKYFNVFGPGEWHKGRMASMVLQAFCQIQKTGRVQLFQSHRPNCADGQQCRDFIFVADAVAMTLFLASLPDRDGNGFPTGGIFNIGSGIASTWLDLVRPIFSCLGMEECIEFIPMPPALRSSYQYHTCANIAKIRGRGFVEPITPLPTAVADYVTRHLVPWAEEFAETCDRDAGMVTSLSSSFS
ncbi:MAG: ADP-glyceromanno-heptose 6-epimerase [Puniceicoccales bacterium]|jgi:ADP-L-glycero-D-manno-heptose 6-epimerase|nr:ADP-glyceromanno-heptose 6-epimerase [Puniceicoccales bacterium]